MSGLLTLVVLAAAPAPADRADRMPEWFEQHMAYMTRGSGCWVADNAAHANEQETAEAYVLSWTWGLGKRTLTGQLYSLENGRRATTHWEMRVWWNPRTNKVVLHQFGATGVVMIGDVTRVAPGRFRAEAEIIAPDGRVTPFADEHEDRDADTFHTRSYTRVGEEWKLNRSYVWTRAPSPPGGK